MAVNVAKKAGTAKKRKRGQPVGRFANRVRYYDFNLVAVVLLLTCFGLVMLYSTSSYLAQVKRGSDMAYFGKQALISAVSIGFALWISRFDYHVLFHLSPFIYVVSMILMCLVPTPLGVTVNGAKRWLKFGPSWTQFQPSEIAKIAVITFIPCLIIKIGRKIKQWQSMVLLLAVGGVLTLGAFLLTDNLSTGIIIGAITVLLIFMAHPKMKPFLIGGAIVGGVLVAVIIILHMTLGSGAGSIEDFRLRRIMVWLQPEQYSKDGGYQIMQALYAIGSGGFFGKGLGNSVQKLGPVPEAQNDMIFSIICEELGLVGASLIILLFLILIWRFFVIATHAKDLTGALIATGAMAHMMIQVILNIAVVTNSIPNTGITLPFISYGGTSVVFLLLEMGLVLSVSNLVE